jgi:uncharacterized coiled-coil protein SlyX
MKTIILQTLAPLMCFALCQPVQSATDATDQALNALNAAKHVQRGPAILALKPVTFHYKAQDTKKAANTPQYGLIAEDVAEVNPDLVMRDADGKPFTVRYDAVNAMLLNEFLKAHKKAEQQEADITQLNSKVANQTTIIAQQQKGIETLTAQLKEQAAQIQQVSARLEVSNPAAQVVSYER